MGILVGVNVVLDGGFQAKYDGFLERIERTVEGATTRVLVGGHYRHRPLLGCPDDHDARVFMERCARAALRHPCFHPEMGDITVARRVALHIYLVWSHRVEERRCKRDRALLAQLEDLGPFAQRAEVNLLTQSPIKHMLPDLVVLEEWPRLADVWHLYVREPAKPHFAVRIPSWVDRELLKVSMFLWAYNEERQLSGKRARRYCLPPAYGSPNVPTNAVLPSYMLREGIAPPPNVVQAPRPVKAEYPRIFEQVKTTNDDRLKRAYTRYQRMFVAVHPDDNLAVRYPSTAQLIQATVKQELREAARQRETKPKVERHRSGVGEEIQEAPVAGPSLERRASPGDSVPSESAPRADADDVADIKPDVSSYAAAKSPALAPAPPPRWWRQYKE
jgi:hypothetical protein